MRRSCLILCYAYSHVASRAIQVVIKASELGIATTFVSRFEGSFTDPENKSPFTEKDEVAVQNMLNGKISESVFSRLKLAKLEIFSLDMMSRMPKDL